MYTRKSGILGFRCRGGTRATVCRCSQLVKRANKKSKTGGVLSHNIGATTAATTGGPANDAKKAVVCDWQPSAGVCVWSGRWCLLIEPHFAPAWQHAGKAFPLAGAGIVQLTPAAQKHCPANTPRKATRKVAAVQRRMRGESRYIEKVHSLNEQRQR